MNANGVYKNHQGQNLELKLDIDLSSQKIYDVSTHGSLKAKYSDELKNLESLIVGKTIEEALNLKSAEQKSLASLPHWLLHQAIENYLGTEAVLAPANDRLCLCFGVTKRDLRDQILKRPDYDLKNVIAETFATSACGSCLPAIKKSLEDIRLANGMIPKEKWAPVKGLYPGQLLIWLDDLKMGWMKRENLLSQFQIEFTSIEGLHLGVSVNTDHDRAEKILMALAEYLKSETGILISLSLDLGVS